MHHRVLPYPRQNAMIHRPIALDETPDRGSHSPGDPGSRVVVIIVYPGTARAFAREFS